MSDVPPPPGSDQPTGPGEPVPPSPYGAPQPPPYGQPAPGQPPSGPAYPAYGQPGAEQPKGKGLAITALILAFIPCLNIVGFVLALVVLIGKKAGKGLGIAALIVSLLWIPGTVLGLIAAGSLFGTPIDDLKTGQCFTADGLTGDDGVSQIEVVSCSKSHDGEVLAVNDLDADEVEAYQDQSAVEACAPLIADDVAAKIIDPLTVTALTQSEDPEAGDNLACVAHRIDGEKLTEKLG